MYTLGALTFGTAPVHTIDQLEDVTVDHGLQHVLQGVAGSVDTEMITNLSQQPTFQFTTTDLKIMLDYCAMDGKALDVLTPDSELITYWRKYAAGGIFDTGSTHVRGTINLGFMILDSLQGQIGQPATGTWKVFVLSDGVADPILWEAPVAYSPVHVAENLWTLGKGFINVNANADFLQGLQSWRLNTGIEVATLVQPGNVYPVEAWISKRNPSIELQCQDMSLIDADLAEKLGGVKGVAIDANGARVFLQKAVKGADLDVEASAVHVKVHVTEGVAHIPRFDGRVSETAPVNIEVKPSKPAAAETIIISTTSAISVAA